MAPPRRIVRQQLEILMDFLEENKNMSKGLLPGAPVSHQKTRYKWAVLAKQLNAVESGALKTPDGWKKYWFEWRHKCRKKAANARRFQSGSEGSQNRCVPLNDLEVRVLELSGKGSVTAADSSSNQLDSFLAEDSDSEPLENLKVRTAPVIENRRSVITSAPRSPTDDESHRVSPPPRWVLDFEERRVAAEERMAAALELMANVMRAQEERQGVLEVRIADALSAIAGTVQDLNSGIQEALPHLYSQGANTAGLKRDVFL
ncbi:hypothetical protein PYW08_000842 [Mythimna loreyi]|uniref:Uncharacterized protein n=1 Tax=Mythimna loreyi TaxID=667449 RepID=A0ACC2QYN7_9NEOP|nr:hypothetical protein PYW08_000842 [Mythimna loreyi]